MKKKKDGETQETIKMIPEFPEFHSPLNANVLFGRFFFNLTLCVTKLRVLVLSFPHFADISITLTNSETSF